MGNLFLRRIEIWMAVAWLLWALPASAITVGQIETFNAGVGDWTEGILSTNFPTIVASGGPQGEGDAYLRNVSAGSGLGGSKLIMFNRGLWAGDYNGARVDRLRMQVNNLGTTEIHLRIAIKGPNAWWVSTDPHVLPADATWRQVIFSLAATELTKFAGTGTLPEDLDNVLELRILSSQEIDFRGDTLAAILGVDNIEAVDSTVPTAAVSWGAVKADFTAP